jgi:hypothetical protein
MSTMPTLRRLWTMYTKLLVEDRMSHRECLKARRAK